jgi:hypothetical protein
LLSVIPTRRKWLTLSKPLSDIPDQ